MAAQQKKKQTTSAKQWKKRTGGVELELPSGNVCKVKRPGMEQLMAIGIMPDSLTPIAMEHVRKAESGGKPKEEDLNDELMARVMEDPNSMADMFASFDKCAAHCVTDPKTVYHMRERTTATGVLMRDDDGNVLWENVPEDERDEDILYTDEVDSMDKMYIFNFVVGGSSDLESFRREHGAAVAALESGE